MIISVDIVRDGVKNTRAAGALLMDMRPMKVGHKDVDPLPVKVENFLRGLSWVEDAKVRFREEGHIFYGDALVVPRTSVDLVENVRQAVIDAASLDWRLHDIVVMPVRTLDDADITEDDVGEEAMG